MSYLKANTAGVYDIPSANIDTLYVRGKKFQDYITELVFEDQLEQSDIDEIKLLLQYLNTSGLSSEWIVDNNNKNQDLKTLITALETKLANIDTTALTESSVLTNENRNSVLKTAIDTATSDLTALTSRVTTAEGDIDGVETRMTAAEGDINTAETNITGILAKTKYIQVEDGDFNDDETIQTFSIGSVPNDITGAKHKKAFFGLGGTSQGMYLEHIDQELDEMKLYNVFGPTTLWSQHNTLRAANTDIGYVNQNVGFYGETISIGSAMSRINIGSVEDPKIGIANPVPDSDFNNSTKITIGKRTALKNTWTYLQGNFYTNEARWEDLPRTDKFTFTQLLAFVPTTGLPLWVVSFALTSSIPNFEYSDTLVLKDGGTGQNKTGEMTTSNELKTKGLVIFNSDLNIARLTPIEGTFVASGTISKTTLNGSIRNSVFLDGGGDNKICLKHHNIAASDIAEWATTEANSKVNVLEIGGDSGILIHQGASNAETDLKLVNTKGGNIVLKCGATNGILGDAKESFTVLHDANYPGAALGRLSPQAYVTDETARTNNPIARLEIDCVANRKGIRLFGYDPDQPFTLVADETNITNQLINTPAITATTATATSLVINGNYTGDTTNRLYKNADGKLFWNGVELGANLGGGGGGLEYYIPLANNVINPAPNPTAQIATETYTNAQQRTITQSTTAVATGLRMARYITAIINKESNPFVEGLQTIQQYLTWSENNTVGQLYGECWFQAEATGGALVYERSYTAGVTTNGLNVLSGTPILAPNGLFNLSVKSVVFPDINVDTFNGATMTIKCRLEARDPTTANWTTLQTSTNTITYTLDNQINQTLTFTEDFVHNQTTKVNAPTAYRFVLFTTSPDSHGHLIQTNSGAVGGDQIAYRLGSGSGDASIRVLLYDGVNAKQTITHTLTPTLVPIELPISPPYQIGPFNNGRLAFDIFMYQPSGAVNANHQMRFFFGEGTISHIESTINEPPAPTPTLAQVLNSGATASQPIHMDGKAITGITTLEGSSGGNWNVKEITAGTNISVSSTSGNYQIENSAPTQDVVAGFGIQTAKSGTTTTIINNASVQALTASSGIAISVDIPTRNATITNTGILGITAGSGLLVTTTNGVATITNTVVAGGQAARDQLFATSSVGLVPNKLGHYAQNWTTQAVSFQPEDIFVSHDGRNCVYIPAGGTSAYVQYSLDYGLTWVNSNFTNANFVSICGSTTGEVLYISKFDPATGSAPNVLFTSRIYVSYNYGVNWSELSLDRTPGAANTWYNRLINKIRCSADGSVVIASTFATTASSGVPNNGTLYISTNGGSTWVVRNITASIAQVADCCMSSNGTIMFASMNGVLGGSTDNGNGGIYRSFDYGATWTKVRNQIAAGTFFFGVIKCDATGRFLVACDQSQTVQATGQVQTSDDYGTVWTWFGDEQARGANAAFVSPGGNLMITAHDATENSRIRYSTDYGRNWITAINFNTVFTLNDNLGGATLRTIASNHDGSVILMRANTNAVYRGIEERGRLALATTSRDLTITPAFGGGYTILNNPSETLWFSGAIDVTTKTSRFALPFTSAGKIDLANYHIRYEIDINWNLEQTQAPPNCYISMGFYGDYNTNSNVVGNNDVRAAHTIWTRKTNVGTGSFPVDIDSTTFEQAFNNVFLVGYAAGQGTSELYRYRTMMKGEISRATTRPAQYSGDFAPNSRLVMNRFYSDAVLYDAEAGTAALEFYHPTIIGQGQHHIQGTGVWEMSRENKYSVIQNGLDGLLIDIYNEAGFYSLQQRGAYATYRIYRVRK